MYTATLLFLHIWFIWCLFLTPACFAFAQSSHRAMNACTEEFCVSYTNPLEIAMFFRLSRSAIYTQIDIFPGLSDRHNPQMLVNVVELSAVEDKVWHPRKYYTSYSVA